MKNIIAIALGGSLGAVSRYLLSKYASGYFGAIFPWGTLAVNLIGSLLIGFLFGLAEKTIIPASIRTFAMIGFIGAFTTFSTYVLESVNLFRDGEIKLGLLNIGISNILGIGCIILGFYMASLLMQK